VKAYRSTVLRVAAAVLAAGAFVNCTLLTSRDIIQCNASSECPSARPFCSDNLCMATGLNGVDGGGNEASASDTGPARECDATDQCALDHVCGPSGRCVPLYDAMTCRAVLPRGTWYRDPGAILIGGYLRDPVNNSRAKDAIARALGAIHNGIGGKPRVVAVLCNKGDRKDLETAPKAIDRLIEMGIPVVFGQFELDEFGSLDLSKNIAIWSTLGNSLSLQAPTNRVRFLLDRLASTASGYQDAINAAIVRATTLNGGTLPSPIIKVVVSNTNDADDLYRALEASSVTVNSSPFSSFPKFVIEPIFTNPSANYGTIATNVRQPLPNVIVGIGGDEIVTKFLPALEQSWPTAPRPVYVLSSRSKYNVDTLQLHGGNTATFWTNFRARIIGVDYAGNQKNLKFFTEEAGDKVPGLASFDHLYDAAYVAAFAAITADKARGASLAMPTPEDMNKAFDALESADDTGTLVYGEGPEAFESARSTLAGGGKIHFVGSTGPFNFDPRHRTRMQTGASFFCFPDNPIDKDLSHYLPSSALGDPGQCLQPTPPP
jgi:hypothetical protein